jgi:hypothetical protein
MEKTIKIVEDIGDGNEKTVFNGLVSHEKVNKTISEIFVYSSKYKDNRFSWKIKDK